jgi:hypothetical protein
VLRGIIESDCDFAGTILEVQYHTPQIRTESPEGRSHGRNVNLDMSDSRIRIVALKALANDDDGLATRIRRAITQCGAVVRLREWRALHILRNVRGVFDVRKFNRFLQARSTIGLVLVRRPSTAG